MFYSKRIELLFKLTMYSNYILMFFDNIEQMYTDLADYLERIKVVSKINDAKLVENANRVLRILKDEVNVSADEKLFVLDAEKALYNEIKKINFTGSYDEYLQSLR